MSHVTCAPRCFTHPGFFGLLQLQNLLPLELSVEQVIAVIDELTVQELRFHNGASLVHTMFTCLYVHATALAVVKVRTLASGHIRTGSYGSLMLWLLSE